MIMTIKVYTRRLALTLQDMGFEVVKVVPDEKKPWYDNYLFKDTDEIRAAIKKILDSRRL